MKKTRFFKAFLLCLLMASTCLAILPALTSAAAVSGPNGKVEGVYGNMDGDHAKAVLGSVSLPLGPAFGSQIDAVYGEIGSTDQIKGVGLQLFTRDPQRYLVGAVGSYVDYEVTQFERYAVEGEYYLGSFSVETLLGHQTGDVDDSALGILDLAWYPAENLRIELGGSFADSDQGRGHVGAEFQVAGGMAVFADVAVGEADYEHALFGVRYYLGHRKTLIRRHREDDPKNRLLIKLAPPAERPSAPTPTPTPTPTPVTPTPVTPPPVVTPPGGYIPPANL